MQDRALERIRGKTERQGGKETEIIARERRLRAEEAEVTRRGQRVISDPERSIPPMDAPRLLGGGKFPEYSSNALFEPHGVDHIGLRP